jgi:hypothetical protein
MLLLSKSNFKPRTAQYKKAAPLPRRGGSHGQAPKNGELGLNQEFKRRGVTHREINLGDHEERSLYSTHAEEATGKVW